MKRVLSHAVSPAWQGQWVLKNYTCHSRAFLCGHTLGSVVKFLVFLVGHLVQATVFCEQASASLAGSSWSKSCLSVLGLPLTAPSHPWGKISSSCALPGQGGAEGKGTLPSHHLLSVVQLEAFLCLELKIKSQRGLK